MGRDDVAALAGGRHCLVVPKVEDPADARGGRRGCSATSQAGLQALIETAAGLSRVGEIADASPRLETLIIGYADLAASLGRPAAPTTPATAGTGCARRCSSAARAAGLQAIDGPHLDIADVEGLRVEAGPRGRSASTASGRFTPRRSSP